MKGTVEIRARSDLTCRRLLLARQWRTHGRGTRESGGRTELRLEDGPIRLRPGAARSFPFEFTAPRKPFTYRGRHFSVDWYLRARADLPKALDARAEHEFLLIPSEKARAEDEGREDPMETVTAVLGPEDRSVPEDAHWAELLLGKRNFQTCLVVPALGVLSLGALLILWFLLSLAGGVLRWVALGFGTAFLVLPGLFLYRARKHQWAEKKLGGVDLVVEPRTVRRGDRIRCRLALQPASNVEIQRVGAVLVAEETAVRDDSTAPAVYKHVVHEKETLLAGGMRAGRGRPVRVEGTLPVPADAPPSFGANYHSLAWIVAIRVGVAGWPDWQRRVPVRIRP